MLNTVAVVALLSATLAQSDALTLSGARLTHGVLGPVRKDNKLLPGDSLFVSFEIQGITVDANGRVQYSTTTEVTDSKKQMVFRSQSRDQTVVNSLGGNVLPAFARIDIGPEQPPGDYTLKVTVTDRSTKKTQTLTQPFTVQPRGFGIVLLTTSADQDAQVPAGLLGPGQSLYVNGAVVGFTRGNGAGGQPHVTLEMRILDASGKPTVAAPFTGAVTKTDSARATYLPIQFLVSLNRPGRFTIELKATDKVGGKTFTQSFPVTVHSPSTK
jgi:hypothetical protein